MTKSRPALQEHISHMEKDLITPRRSIPRVDTLHDQIKINRWSSSCVCLHSPAGRS